jgi:hypothetical protein
LIVFVLCHSSMLHLSPDCPFSLFPNVYIQIYI